MTHPALWRSAERKDVDALNHFTCTDAKPELRRKDWRDYTPRWWEYEVQSSIRNLRPPFNRHGKQVLLREDSSGLSAVALLEELDGPAHVEISLIGVASRCRGQGVSDEAVDEALDRITDAALESSVPEVLVQAWVWFENRASQALWRRYDFAEPEEHEAGVGIWSLRLLTSAEDIEEPE